MPGTSIKIINIVLKLLVENRTRNYTLEDLTAVIFPLTLDLHSLEDWILKQREYQSEVLDTLLFLSDANLIILDAATDECRVNYSVMN